MATAVTCTALTSSLIRNITIGVCFVYGFDVTCWLAATVDRNSSHCQSDSIAGPYH